jgi:protein SCO1/2/putative membrane protein
LKRSYQVGLQVVVWTILACALVAPVFGLRPAVERSAEDLGRIPLPLGSFTLQERSGRTITDGDLSDRVWIAAFVFTRCPSSCPRISSTMKGFQGVLEGTGVRLVSISVDPGHDTPRVLADYAARLGADPDRWWFVTASRDTIYHLVLDQFKVPLSESSPEDRRAGAEAVSHSARLALVDRGNRIVGYFDSNDPEATRNLLARARRLDRSWIARLPALNAALNATSGLLLLVGWSLVRSGRVRAHAGCMIASLVSSALFLSSYLVYHFQVGSVRFRGFGAARLAYMTILSSHTLLAIVVVPLVVVTLSHVLRGRFAEHARIARVTFPIWLYVSTTGVVVYWMLYHLDVPSYPT